MAQGKRWCFTLNNPYVNDHPTIWLKNHEKYGFQYEKGINNTMHIQGWVTFNKKMRLQELKNLNSKCHWEGMKGSLKKNEEYCSKSETKISIYYSNSQSIDLKPMEQLKLDCENEEQLKTIYEMNFNLSCKFHAFIQKYHSMQQKPRDHITAGMVIIGPTGCGKTGQVRHSFDLSDMYWKPHGPWWDGYANQKIVIFDEFYSWYSYGDMLRLLDRYPLKVPIKGSFQEFNSELVIFTSNQHWDKWYPNIPNKASLMRRLSVKIDMYFMEKKDWWPGPLKVRMFQCSVSTILIWNTK
ncbi:replication associated protein [Chifec virus UA13_77]|nr:replication associated protein [Chifec virus UA13_77]